jgi:hypothetical protein
MFYCILFETYDERTATSETQSAALYQILIVCLSAIAQSEHLRYSYIVSILSNGGVDLLMSQDHRPRSETRQLMIDIVARSERPLTRTEIVNRLNRKKTPHLINMMDALVEEGVFRRSIVTFNNGVTGYEYSIARGLHAGVGRPS